MMWNLENYWISGPKKNGEDGLYGPRPTPIDQDVREEYWTKIRKLPDKRAGKPLEFLALEGSTSANQNHDRIQSERFLTGRARSLVC
jgi:hypothetical protein